MRQQGFGILYDPFLISAVYREPKRRSNQYGSMRMRTGKAALADVDLLCIGVQGAARHG